MYLIISHHSHCYFCYVPCSRSLSLISEAWVIHLGFGELRVTVQVAHNEYIVSLGEPMHKQRAREKKNTAAVRIYSKDGKEKIQLKLSSLQLGCREKLCSWISRGRNNNQLERGIRETWTRWLIYSRRQERGLSLSTVWVCWRPISLDLSASPHPLNQEWPPSPQSPGAGLWFLLGLQCHDSSG